ncbi:MAG: hypothetical protein ACK4TA_24020, partial [Saprospiraceae bacterium]
MVFWLLLQANYIFLNALKELMFSQAFISALVIKITDIPGFGHVSLSQRLNNEKSSNQIPAGLHAVSRAGNRHRIIHRTINKLNKYHYHEKEHGN